jgi:gliding motility-associated-like protein
VESNVLELTVNPLPSALITGNLSACLSTTLTAATDASSPEYTWYRDVSILSGQTSATLDVITSGAYKVKIKNNTTQCEQTSAASDVIINPQPTAVISGTLTACGSTVLAVTTDAAAPSYTWFKDNTELPGETGATLSILSSGLYKVKVKNGVTFCERTATNKTVTINALPSISITGSLTACNTTTLSVVTDAASPTYTWYMNDAMIAGETSSTLNVTSSGDYKVKVRNGVTTCENTSSVSTVTLKTLPSITITGALSGCGSTTLTAVTDASLPAFAWYKDNILMAGENSGTLNATSSGEYKARVIDGVTTCENTSSASTVTINLLPAVSITGNTSVCVNTTLTAVTDASSPSYFWYKNENIIDGETNSTLQVTIPGDYKVKVINGITTCRNTSAIATVTINQPNAGLELSGSINLCSGTGTMIVVNSSEAGISYQLRNSSGNINIGSPVAGTGGSINLPTGNLIQTTTFSVLASNVAAGCSTQLNETETVTVDLPSAGGAITGGISPVTYGNSTGTLTLTGYTGNIVKWQKMVEAGSWLDITNTSSTFTETPSSAGSWLYRVVVKNGTCPDAFSSVKQIVVNKADQTITLNPLPDKILVGETFTLSATSSTNLTVLFESTNNDVASVTGNILTGISKGKTIIRAYNNGDQNYEPAETTGEIKVHSTHSKIMNLFTPNNDGINDYWELPDMPEWGKCDVRVFNRWGKLVFANPDYDNLWDGISEGSPLPEGAYYYIIKTQNAGVVKGTVNLVR